MTFIPVQSLIVVYLCLVWSLTLSTRDFNLNHLYFCVMVCSTSILSEGRSCTVLRGTTLDIWLLASELPGWSAPCNNGAVSRRNSCKTRALKKSGTKGQLLRNPCGGSSLKSLFILWRSFAEGTGVHMPRSLSSGVPPSFFDTWKNMLGVVWVRWVLAALLGWRKGFTWMEFPDGAEMVLFFVR